MTRSKDWQIRLEGGPFDGDEGIIGTRTPPPKMWVEWCGDCNDTHWQDEPTQGCEVYVKQDEGINHAKYVYEDIANSGGGVIEFWEEMVA